MGCNAKLAMALADDAFAKQGSLGATQFISLTLIGNGVARTPRHLAAFLGFNTGGASRHIDRLEKAGLVTRVRSKRNRRSVGLELTEAGATQAVAFVPRMVDLWNGIRDGFNSVEYRVLVTLLEKLFLRLQVSQRPGREFFPM